MARELSGALLAFTVLAATSVSASPALAEREYVRRRLVITEATIGTVHEVHVAPGADTTLEFLEPVNEVKIFDTRQLMSLTKPQGAIVDLVPRRAIPPSAPIALKVTLKSGTLLTFKLLTVPKVLDLVLTVDVQAQREGAEAVTALKMVNADLDAQLSECRAATPAAGVRRIAELVLHQDPSSPQAVTAEGHQVKARDKQSRLLVEVNQLYRLFDASYLLLTVENHDPDKPWVLDRADLRVVNGSAGNEVKILGAPLSEQPTLPPGARGKVVIAFQTAELSKGQKYEFALFEKAGGRHVRISFEP